MNESCRAYESVLSHTWIGHVTRIEMSHVTHMNKSCHTYEQSCHTYKCVFTHIEERCHTYECIFTHTEESCHTYECVFAHFEESYHTNEGVVSLTHEGLMSNTWRGHMNDSCQKHEEVASYIWISHVRHMIHTYECTRWGGLWDSVTDLEIGFKTAKYRSTQVELLFSVKIGSAGLHKVAKTLRAMQGADGKDAPLTSSSAAPSGSESCAACPVLTPCDSPLRLWLSQAGCLAQKQQPTRGGLQVFATFSRVESCSWGWSQSLPHRLEWVTSSKWMSHGHWAVIRFNGFEKWWNESRHLWLKCVTWIWVMSRMKESCHTWISHVTHMNDSCHTYEWVMSHIWMSHVIHMNESCHTYEWVMAYIWMSHGTHVPILFRMDLV